MSQLFKSETKLLELQLQHQSFQYSGLVSFKIDWFDLFAVQKIVTSLLQNRNSEALSLLYGPTHICARLLEKP